MKFLYTFDKHSAEPEKSVEAYTKEKKVELGKWVNQHKTIYLDTKFWLLLRDAHLSRTNVSDQQALLQLLRDGAKNNKIICPISEDVFLEVIKQTDDLTLKTTVGLIDDLSASVSLVQIDERFETEVMYFVRSLAYSKLPLHNLQDFVWTKLAYTNGLRIPQIDLISQAENRMIQKSFFDQMWQMSLLQMITLVGRDRLLAFPHMPDLSVLLNEEKDNYHNKGANFRRIFLEELKFVLLRKKTTFEDMFAYLFEEEFGHPPAPEEIRGNNPGEAFASLIYNAFKNQKAGRKLPTLEIEAGIHAQLIFDKTRRYKANDLHDIKHAIAAIPYCDFFFTEKNLREFVIRQNLAYDNKYNCTVVSSLKDAVFVTQKVVC